MALTQTDIEALDRAIASGELTVSYDGRTVTYRSIGELKRAREHVAGIVAAAAGSKRTAFYFTPAGRRD